MTRSPALGASEVVGNPNIAKVSIVGIGMRSHVGVASTMFRALSQEGVNIQMISTSEIKTSVVIDEKYLELAVRAAHRLRPRQDGIKSMFCRNRQKARYNNVIPET